MPGLPAIRAALHPDSGNSLYFVSRGNGSHVFSATLDEHQRAVDQYQKH
ncbi:endolytic transglycosylase MltG [Methylomagnum sp.]